MPPPGKYHCCAHTVSSRNHFFIADGAAGLNDCRGSRSQGRFNTIGKGEQRIAGDY
jgi:hypothetical protein